MTKTVLFKPIQFSKSKQLRSIWPIDRTLSGATTQSQSGPGSDGSKEVLRIPQSSSITGTSSSDCLVSYPGHLFGESYPSAELQSVYSAVPADWWSLTPLQRCSRYILQHQPTGLPLVESYPSAELQSVYSAAPADWWSLTPLQSYSQCILQHQPTGFPLVESYSPAELQSVYSATPADWCVSLHCRDAVGVLCSASRQGKDKIE